MKKIIKEMYLEDVDGKGTNILTLVDEDGEEYQGEVEVYNSRVDLEFIRLAK